MSLKNVSLKMGKWLKYIIRLKVAVKFHFPTAICKTDRIETHTNRTGNPDKTHTSHRWP